METILNALSFLAGLIEFSVPWFLGLLVFIWPLVLCLILLGIISYVEKKAEAEQQTD